MELTTTMSRAAGFPGDAPALNRRSAPTSGAILLLLAHEDGLARAGLRALLEREADVIVVGEVSRGDDAIAVAGELRPDIVLMGLELPGPDALQTTRLLVAGGACTHVLILGSCGGDEELFGALHAGASGFVVNETKPAELLHAVRSSSSCSPTRRGSWSRGEPAITPRPPRFSPRPSCRRNTMSAPQRVERHLRREALLAPAPLRGFGRAADERAGSQRALVIASLLRCPEQGSKMSPHDRRA
jgi:DNA-binding NarL/FixJ family response regulator